MSSKNNLATPKTLRTYGTQAELARRFYELMPNDSNEISPRYRWPWFVLAGVVLFFALAIFWVGLAANKLKHEREFNAPLPTNAPAR